MADTINPFDKDTADLKQAKKEKLYQAASFKPKAKADTNSYTQRGNVPGAVGNAISTLRQWASHGQPHTPEDTP